MLISDDGTTVIDLLLPVKDRRWEKNWPVNSPCLHVRDAAGIRNMHFLHNLCPDTTDVGASGFFIRWTTWYARVTQRSDSFVLRMRDGLILTFSSVTGKIVDNATFQVQMRRTLIWSAGILAGLCLTIWLAVRRGNAESPLREQGI